MSQDETLRYWQTMRKAMEAAGDTSSAIYQRARSISEGLGDPLGYGDPFASPLTLGSTEGQFRPSQ
jgi:hypothetical protein